MPRFELTWLGQASFPLESRGTRIVIDPWASPHEARLIPPPPLELVAQPIDAVLVTHEHLDHLDLPFLHKLAQAWPRARLVLPEAIAAEAEAILPTTMVKPWDAVDIGPMRIDVVAAVHGVSTEDAYDDGRGRFVGFVLRGPDFVRLTRLHSCGLSHLKRRRLTIGLWALRTLQRSLT